ncbi:hypothetical protein O7623_17550 [Solwaraspora sp. WMMD791]|uniref:hypothetical protein n=1 Tax=Solwaraspora sp. WMMD791 TaxID=3016086 RepID=UPI00249AE4BA|nr:hypothetical protein [Solwaraspora sp. WMMD791]WFE25210.1 hypothetical protein O7623_17550 [Solwaraspora sp. WMMD791]
MSRRIDHAWSTYQHGDYPRLLRMTPELLDAGTRPPPAEIRARPSARTLVADIARTGPQVAGVARLATALGLTC